MSVIGTGVAAGVAQTGLQAQRVARDQDRKKAQDDQNARRVRESFDAHLHLLEGVNQIEPVDRLEIDGHLPQERLDQQSHQDQEDLSEPDSDADHVQSDAPAPNLIAASPGREGSLYRHLDVEG